MTRRPPPTNNLDDDPVLAVVNAICFFVTLAILIFGVICCARAAEYSVTVDRSYSVTVEETLKPKRDARPVVTLYSASWCAPCQQAKADLKAAAKDLPFDIRIIDVSNGGQPGFVKSIPWVAWHKSEGQVWQQSYPGVRDLIEQWQKSQQKSSSTTSAAGTSIRTASPSPRLLALRQFASGYSGQTTRVRGSTLSHLMDDNHGFTAGELAGLNEWELERLHSACHHFNLHARQLRAIADKRGIR